MAYPNQLLRTIGIPVFSSVKELSELMHFDEELLNQINLRSRSFYRRYQIIKRSGGVREIHQPVRSVKAVQSWILRRILDKLSPTQYATAFRRGVRLTDNAIPHTSNRYFLSVDIEDFFPSISTNRVYNIFLNIGFDKQAARILANLCTASGKLPQGGITSPAISNLVLARLDRRIAGLCSKEGIVYTRYADDFTFSTNQPNGLRKVYPIIKRIINSEGFRLNQSKVRFSGPDTACEVTGLIKDASLPQFSIGRHRYRQIRAEIHRLSQGRQGNRYKTKASIIGVLAFVDSVSPNLANKLARYKEKLYKE